MKDGVIEDGVRVYAFDAFRRVACSSRSRSSSHSRGERYESKSLSHTLDETESKWKGKRAELQQADQRGSPEPSQLELNTACSPRLHTPCSTYGFADSQTERRETDR